MESVFMHFDANYISIMCAWAIVNYIPVGTSVTKQKDKDLAVVHVWSLTIPVDPRAWCTWYLVPGT